MTPILYRRNIIAKKFKGNHYNQGNDNNHQVERKQGGIEASYYVDERIKYALNCFKVKLIGEDGKTIGEIPINDAIARARNAHLNLVCVSKNAPIPICKIFDFKKFIFEKKKKDRENLKKSRQSEIKIKTLKMDNINIGESDFLRLVRQTEKYLKSGDDVKICFRLRGRLRYEDQTPVKDLLLKFLSMISDVEYVIKSDIKKDVSDDNKQSSAPKEYSVLLGSKIKKGSLKNAKNENKEGGDKTPKAN